MTRFYHFHVNVFAAPRPASFGVTWEEAAAALEQMPRMIFELDGSFVLAGSVARDEASPSPTSSDRSQSRRWQVDGHLFDFADRLYRVELHGECPPPRFDDLLRCLGWPTQLLAFEMVREGVTLSEAEFRAGAAEATGSS